MKIARLVVALVFAVLGLVPLVLAAAFWWVAARIAPSASARVHADRIGGVLRSLYGKPKASAAQLERIATLEVERFDPVTFEPLVPTAVPTGRREKTMPPLMNDARLVADVERLQRVIIRVDDDHAVLGAHFDANVRH